MTTMLEIKRLTVGEKTPPMPFYATDGAAGIDLAAFCESDITVEPSQRELIKTGLCVAIPEGCVGIIAVRSSLGVKHGIALSNGIGVIDCDYRGELMVSVYNASDVPFTVKNGDRIAQLIIMPYLRADICERETLTETERNTGGFGSTGK